jgi:hypothetical protein
VHEHGMSALQAAEPRPKDSPQYMKFLEVWAESRRLIESVVPEALGQPMDGKLDKTVFEMRAEPRR